MQAMRHSPLLRLHNATWPGLVGKGEGAPEPAIGLDRMLQLTEEAEVDGERFDGVDLFLHAPHLDVHADRDGVWGLADRIASHGLRVGSVVAPVYPHMIGGSAMGDREERRRFVQAVEAACRYASMLDEHGIRSYGVVRIDSAASPVEWVENPLANTRLIAETFREAAVVAEDHGQRIAAEGEICWAAMHSWKAMLGLLEAVGKPGLLGFQADLAHTYLYLLGYNAPEAALLEEGHSEEAFWQAYHVMTNALGPWLLDFHVAQTDGSVFGSGSHDKTGRHCPVDSPGGKIDVVRCSRAWLLNEDGRIRNGIRHVCWDGCMFPNAVLEASGTWNRVLNLMQAVRDDLQDHQDHQDHLASFCP